jgi:uncharacterized membrane protein
MDKFSLTDLLYPIAILVMLALCLIFIFSTSCVSMSMSTGAGATSKTESESKIDQSTSTKGFSELSSPEISIAISPTINERQNTNVKIGGAKAYIGNSQIQQADATSVAKAQSEAIAEASGRISTTIVPILLSLILVLVVAGIYIYLTHSKAGKILKTVTKAI